MTITELNGYFPDMDMGKNLPDGSVLYRASCPCHDDRSRSLGIVVQRNENGEILQRRIVCHAGCSTKEIIETVGLPPETATLPATRPEPVQVVSLDEARSLIGSMSGQIGALAEMLRVTNERMQALENEVRSLGAAVRTLEKVTPQQASRINKAIRERGLELCREYRIGVTITPVVQGVGSVPEQARFEASEEKAKKISAAIRAEVRTMAGAKTAREVARCDYETVIGYVQAWEDYETIQRIRRG